MVFSLIFFSYIGLSNLTFYKKISHFQLNVFLRFEHKIFEPYLGIKIYFYSHYEPQFKLIVPKMTILIFFIASIKFPVSFSKPVYLYPELKINLQNLS